MSSSVFSPAVSVAVAPPTATRSRLLEAALAEIHRQGFQAASLDRILADTGLTKGALYHHFRNKAELGYAVVEELIACHVQAMWVTPLADADDPITRMQQVLHAAGAAMTRDDLLLGCPLNNLAQELSPVDEEFRLRLDAVFTTWRDGLAEALRRGQARNTVDAQVNPEHAATFIVASMEGCIGTAKTAQSLELLMTCGEGLMHYMDTLRPGQQRTIRHA